MILCTHYVSETPVFLTKYVANLGHLLIPVLFTGHKRLFGMYFILHICANLNVTSQLQTQCTELYPWYLGRNILENWKCTMFLLVAKMLLLMRYNMIPSSLLKPIFYCFSQIKMG